MKKIIATIAAATMLMSTTAMAGLNPQTIEDSSSRNNIIKLINNKVEDGQTSGVTGGYAWVMVNGEIISLNVNELRKAGSLNAAIDMFENYVSSQIAADIEFMFSEVSEAQKLFEDLRASAPELPIEVIKRLVTAQFPDVVFYEKIVERIEYVEVINEVIVEVPVVEYVDVIRYVDRDVIIEVPVEIIVEVADPDAYNNGFAAGVASVTPEDGVHQSHVNTAYSDGYTAGVASVDITTDNQASYDAGHAAGAASVDITVDNQAQYDAGYAAGAASVNADPMDGNYDEGFTAGVASVDITSDNQASYDAGFAAGAASVTPEDGINQSHVAAARAEGFAAGAASITPEDGINQSHVTAARAEGFAAGVASVDITTDNQAQYDAGFAAGVASVDITSDNADAFAAGAASVDITSDNAAAFANGVASVDITTDNAAAIAAYITAVKATALANMPTTPTIEITSTDILNAFAERAIKQGYDTAAELTAAISELAGTSTVTYSGQATVVGGNYYYGYQLNPYSLFFVPDGDVGTAGYINLVSPAGISHSFYYATGTNNFSSVLSAVSATGALVGMMVAEAAFEAGYGEGFATGLGVGYSYGYADGYSDGYEDGYADGFTDGVNSVN